MVNNNNLVPIEAKKPVETVYEIEKYEIKKSPLSLVARGKVNNRSGSNYLSENKGNYGPGSAQSSYSDDSDEARMNRYYARTTTNVTTVVGIATTAVSEIGYALSSDSDTKDAWKYASELGQDMMTGVVVGNFVDDLRLPHGLKKG